MALPERSRRRSISVAMPLASASSSAAFRRANRSSRLTGCCALAAGAGSGAAAAALTRPRSQDDRAQHGPRERNDGDARALRHGASFLAPARRRQCASLPRPARSAGRPPDAQPWRALKRFWVLLMM